MEDNTKIEASITPIAEIYYSHDSKWGTYIVSSSTPISQFKEDTFNGDLQYRGKMSGNMQLLDLGMVYKVTGTMVNHPKYGWSIKPSNILPDIKMPIDKQRDFLRSVLTHNQANTLLTEYPNIIEMIMESSKKGITEVSKMGIDFSKLKGITENNFVGIKDKIVDNFVLADILALLSPLGITYASIKTISNAESNPFLLKEKLVENPYILMRIKGMGFKKVDGIALKLNPSLINSKFRAITCIRYLLQEVGNNEGHVWVDMKRIYKQFIDNTPQCKEIFLEVIEEQNKHPTFLHVEGNRIGLQSRYKVELEIRDYIKSICSTEPNTIITDKHIDKGIKTANKEQGFEYDEYQTNIIKESVKNKLVVITGSAGSGKTSLTRGILNIFKEANMRIQCCALSAKATKVIEKNTGFPAYTLHRAFKINENKKPDEKDIILSCDVLLIDECSMVNSQLINYALSHIQPSTIVVCVGDDKQLPPIGYGNVLRDILANRKLLNSSSYNICIQQLEKIYRQADDSGIVHDANIIRNNKYPFETLKSKMVTGKLKDMFYIFMNNSDDIYKEALSKYLAIVENKSADDVIMLCPVKTNGKVCAENFNQEIQNILVGDRPYINFGNSKFHEGAKIMQTQNDYDRMVFNGEEGYIKSVSKDECIVQFNGKDFEDKYTRADLDNIQLAYCSSVHRSQGSGYKIVIYVMDNNAYMLLDSCLLYTGITRAEKKCMVIANPNSFNICIEKNKQINRQTYLIDMLKEIK